MVRIFAIPASLLMLAVGFFLLKTFWEQEATSKELSSFVPVTVDTYKVQRNYRKSTIDYTYTVDGVVYRDSTFAPYPKLHKLAAGSSQIRALSTRTQEQQLVVYVDPEDPSRSSVLRAWPREGRLVGIAFGGIVFWVGWVFLYRTVRKVPRYDLLFRRGE
ncbi:MAG: DUF3592 domain-containing protein [Bacteroidota bacterium]